MFQRVRIIVSKIDIPCLKEVKSMRFILKMTHHVIWIDPFFFTNHDERIGVVATLISQRWVETNIQHSLDP